MASTSKCPFCGAPVRSDERQCPQCGGENEQYVPVSERTVFLPKTIGELKEYCAERGMPLLRMRFFIGEDYRKPKAFGIYRDGDRFVVYKNKADGSRAIRYQGPDEAFAVNELFMKLLDECHKRGIYPDGKPSGNAGGKRKSSGKSLALAIGIGFVLIVLLCLLLTRGHARDGYYRLPGERVAYRYGDRFYQYSSAADIWYETNYGEYTPGGDDFLGNDFNSDWGTSDFKASSAWSEIEASHSSGSSDYDGWDSGDTDWDSDW